MRKVFAFICLVVGSVAVFAAPAAADYCVTVYDVPPPTDWRVCLPI